MTLPDNTPTYDLDLPGRVKKALIRNGFMVLGQLRAMPRSGPERFDWLTLPRIGYGAARDIECFLAALDEASPEPAPEPAPEPLEAPLDDDTYWEADLRAHQGNQRRDAAISCICWLVDNPSVETVLLADTNGSGRLRHILDEDDILFLVQRWQDYESDQGCAAAEAAYEQER